MSVKSFIGGIAIGGALTLACIMQAIPAAGDAVREATGIPQMLSGIVEPAVQAREALDELEALSGSLGTGCTVEQAQLAELAVELELQGITCTAVAEEVR